MSTMNAVRFHGQRDIRLESIPVPTCEPHQVKIAPKFCGICGKPICSHLLIFPIQENPPSITPLLSTPSTTNPTNRT